MHFYQFDIGLYLTHTAHLEPLEDLAYRRMLDLYFMQEAPLPLEPDKIARLIRMRTHCECIANVLQEFFVRMEDGYHNAGADKQLEKIYAKSAKAKASAVARWNKKAPKAKGSKGNDANDMRTHSESNANGMLPNTYNLIPNTDISPKAKTKRKKQMPDNFVLTQGMAKKAVTYWQKKNRLDLEPNVRDIFEGFVNHHKQHGSKMMCWDAAWQTWYTNAIKFERVQNGNSGHGRKLTPAERTQESYKRHLAEHGGDVPAMDLHGGDVRPLLGESARGQPEPSVEAPPSGLLIERD